MNVWSLLLAALSVVMLIFLACAWMAALMKKDS